MAGYHVENFGCRASQADGDAIASEMMQLGLVAASTLAAAEVVVVNTCTVTEEADRDARAYIRRVQRANGSARIVVTGCYAQRAPEELASLPGVFAVVGNSHKRQVAAIATQNFVSLSAFVPLSAVEPVPAAGVMAGTQALHAPIFAHSDFSSADNSIEDFSFWSAAISGHTPGRTRPSLKIQDGCGNRCTFCVIPTTRGASRSQPRGAVLDTVARFVASGGTELVLSGINLGRWGRDLNPGDCFADLVAAILETTALSRLRISSVEPMDWSESLIALLAQYGQREHPSLHPRQHPRLARHAHLPLQSGSDAVLRRMHRRYRPWHYAAKLEAICAAVPQAAIGADVMVGFPGESDAEFQESYDFIAAQPLTYLHLFPFSARPGTPAWELHRQHPVPTAVVQQRMAALRGLMEQKNRAFRQSLVGQSLSVVTLETSAAQRALGHTEALSDNFVPVQVVHAEETLPANRMLRVIVRELSATGVIGESLLA